MTFHHIAKLLNQIFNTSYTIVVWHCGSEHCAHFQKDTNINHYVYYCTLYREVQDYLQ